MPSETHRLLLAARATTGPTLRYVTTDGTIRTLPLTLDDELPRTAEGMLIGWPERDDPDGPLEPMRPASWWNDAACMREDAARIARYDRDAALIAAIGKLWG